MADRLYLSCWLEGFHEGNMLTHFTSMLRKFPISRLQPRMHLHVYEDEFVEPTVFEGEYEDLNHFDAMMADAAKYRTNRHGFEVVARWELWQWDGTDWKLLPARVSLECFAPQFERESGEDLRIEFGVESLFLPQLEVAGNHMPMVQGNIRSLLKLVQDLEQVLPVEKRLLWSESGANFAERLQALLNAASQVGRS